MPSKGRDWETIKREFITSDIPTMTKFFAKKKISRGTWTHHTKGWKKERDVYRRSIDAEILAETKKTKVLTASKQAEYMSTIVLKTLERWQAMNKKIDDIESKIKKKKTYTDLEHARLAKQLNEITRMLPALVESVELLEGRATSRPDLQDKTSAEMSRLEKEFDEKKKRMQKALKGGKLTLVKKEEQKAG